MTKKSYNRQMRDELKARQDDATAELANNTSWDELRNIYGQCCSLLKNAVDASQLMKRQDIFDACTRLDEALGLISALKNDLPAMLEEVNAIWAIHSARSGRAEVEDILLTFEIYEKYQLWIERYNAIIVPTMGHLLEITNEAEVAIIAKNQEITAAPVEIVEEQAEVAAETKEEEA